MKRPFSVTIISWFFITMGCVTVVAALQPLVATGTSGMTSHDLLDLGLVLFVRLLAIVCGVFILRGFNWARWLLIVWMAFHVAISIEGTAFVLIVHSLIFIIVFYILLRPASSAYFRGNEPQVT